MEVPLLVDDFLRRGAQLYSGKLAVVDGAIRHTYADLQLRANQMSHALLGAGITKGDRVGILSPNSHFFLESFYATSQIGAILVPLNYRLQSTDLEYILDHAGVKAILVDWEYTGVVDEIRSSLPKIEHYVVATEDAQTPKGWLNWNALIATALTDAPAKLHERYEGLSPVHTVNNLALVVWGLLAGADDYSVAIGDTVAAGWDTDCNGATVGGLWGLSGRGIPEAWTAPWQERVGVSLAGTSEVSLNELVERQEVVSVREVRRELETVVTREWLKEWIRGHSSMFLTPGQTETEFVAEIFAIPHFQALVGAKQRLKGSPVADPWLVACARAMDGCVVTEEGHNPNAAKIPNVCEHFGIRCIDLEGFMADRGWRF